VLPIANVEGKYSDSKFEQLLNTPLPKDTEQFGTLKNTLVKLVHELKAPSPRLIEEELISTVVMPDPLKAYF
jgi:hypothetical protein